MRNNLSWGKCSGNVEHKHFFNYFGTPDTYKIVIVNNNTGETKISNTINRTDFNSKITIDYETMNVTNGVSEPSKTFHKLIMMFIPVLLTVLVEIFILFIFKMSNKNNRKIVIITNIITNIMLQISLIIVDLIPKSTNVYTTETQATGIMIRNSLFIFEIFIIIVETLIYCKKFEGDNLKKTILYTIVANIITGYLTLIEWFTFNL